MRLLATIAIVGILFVSGCSNENNQNSKGLIGRLFTRDIQSEATIAEINAVAKLRSDEAMEEGFLAIASRAGITPSAQRHMIVPALSKLYHESSKVEVLLELIKNPAFSHEAKKQILKNLFRLESERSRTEVINTINHKQIPVAN